MFFMIFIVIYHVSLLNVACLIGPFNGNFLFEILSIKIIFLKTVLNAK